MLKLLKISKKEKMQSKSASFAETLLKKVTFNTSNSISKSSLRRRKRREREQLKPKMDELLSSLDDIQNQTKIVVKDPETGGYIKATRPNLPNANTKKGQQQIRKQEGENFKNVLKNPEFRVDPFAALKFAIANNVKNNQNESLDKNDKKRK